MRIALDWDGTASEDPSGFAAIVTVLRARGHEIVICTMRYQDKEPIDPDLLVMFAHRDHTPIEVYYTGRKAKFNYMNLLGIKIDVWIDDKPHFLYLNG